ncbi:hypothetical protein KUL98_002842 [Vibrio parahaemolyticus]|nr:hypothetical protein [Vibrio parahaemolyticus]
MNKNKSRLACAVIATMALLTGCGGSDSGGTSNNSDETTPYNLSGTAQKGPIQPGSIITIQALDNNLEQTGEAYTTQIEDYEGSYSISENFNGHAAELFAEGYYMNELNGSSDEQISLSTYANLEASETININIATALMKRSIMNMVKSGLSFDEANQRATSELLNLYGYESLSTDDINFYSTSLSNESGTSSILLMISAATLSMANENNVDLTTQIQLNSNVLANTSNDWDRTQTQIRTVMSDIYTDVVYDNTKQYFDTHGLDFEIPPLDYFVDKDGDGQFPDNDLPIVKGQCVAATIDESEWSKTVDIYINAVDYQQRNMTFSITQEPTLGTAAIVYEEGQPIARYNVEMPEGTDIVEDSFMIDTNAPVQSNAAAEYCVRIERIHY